MDAIRISSVFFFFNFPTWAVANYWIMWQMCERLRSNKYFNHSNGSINHRDKLEVFYKHYRASIWTSVPSSHNGEKKILAALRMPEMCCFPLNWLRLAIFAWSVTSAHWNDRPNWFEIYWSVVHFTKSLETSMLIWL